MTSTHNQILDAFRKRYVTENGYINEQESNDLESFLRSALLEAEERGRTEPSKFEETCATEPGYCCACGYDIAGFEQAIKAERKAVLEIGLCGTGECGCEGGVKQVFDKLLEEDKDRV